MYENACDDNLWLVEIVFQDMTNNSEYHAFLNYVQKFVHHYLKLAISAI